MTMIIPATLEDARAIQHEPILGVDCVDAIARAIARSAVCFTGRVEGEIVAIWGIQADSLLSRSGYLWMTARPNIEPFQFVFAKHAKLFVERESANFDILYGLIDDREAIAKRFVRWLGFQLSAPLIFNSVPICRFHHRWR